MTYGKMLIQHQKYSVGDRFNLRYGSARVTGALKVSDGRVIYVLGYDEGGPKYPAAFSQDGLEAHLAELSRTETQE